MRCPDNPDQIVKLTIKQCKFGLEGFASTVWDSSIVLAKHLERWPERITGCRCLDLSAGCGLLAVVLARLGAAAVTATDLPPNLPLLAANCEANAPGRVAVLPHRWGADAAPLQPPFDVIVAADVMYVTDAVPDLVASLAALSSPQTYLLVAHGRNRFAEAAFLAAARRAGFTVELLPHTELDEAFCCSDVDVLRLRKLQG